ncbi:hypothetical cyanophage protein [Synechococcus phage S-CRM01]|uniref:hypothetical cyanophage protein n=1 Tax=Synechococcus phage S-CRM01 TaxID=1026955 RepID=UPI000209E437|nr:hypothetical cyanophage protein [Synechococcus phage S-CRM01]AEC53176.1 hypothetical cyanophage protein [Synechococcus phage S-CRM01]
MTVLDAPSKVQFQVEGLIEVLNERWKVDAIESGHIYYHQLTYSSGGKFYKLICNYGCGHYGNQRSVYMFVDKLTGNCYKAASWNARAAGVRYTMDQLIENPELCDPYGSFLYLR